MAQQQALDPAQLHEVLANTLSPTETIRRNGKLIGFDRFVQEIVRMPFGRTRSRCTSIHPFWLL